MDQLLPLLGRGPHVPVENGTLVSMGRSRWVRCICPGPDRVASKATAHEQGFVYEAGKHPIPRDPQLVDVDAARLASGDDGQTRVGLNELDQVLVVSGSSGERPSRPADTVEDDTEQKIPSRSRRASNRHGAGTSELCPSAVNLTP